MLQSVNLDLLIHRVLYEVEKSQGLLMLFMHLLMTLFLVPLDRR